MASKLNIVSLNCRGLSDREKRIDFFSLFKQKHYDVILLQDTHWDINISNQALEEWDYELVAAPFNTRSRSTAILINNTFEFTLGNRKNDINDNYSLVEISLPTGLDLLIGSIYAPNQDNPVFIRNLADLLEEYENPNILLVGDWNLTRNFALMNTFNLVDAWISKRRSIAFHGSSLAKLWKNSTLAKILGNG